VTTNDACAGAEFSRAGQVLAATIGNALEWYDFVVFGFVAVVIARLFFPTSSQYAGLLLTFATFGVGFFMRPLGAIVLGMYADRAGRKAAMLLVIALMTLAVAMIAFAPTYASIGIAAPVLVVLARLLQGFATGGEFAASTSFLVERAAPQHRGLLGSLQYLGQGLAALLGSAVGTLITRGLSVAQCEAWGWRIPFLVGLLIGPVGLYIRSRLRESDEFLAATASPGRPVRLGELLGEHRLAITVSLFLVVCGTIDYYVLLLYIPTYAKVQLALPLDVAFTSQLSTFVWMNLLIPVFGALSDHLGRKSVLLAGALGSFALPYPMFAWLHAAPSFERLLTAQLVMCTAAAIYWGPLSTTVCEQFPTRVRATGMGIAYNFAVMLFGGFAPLIVTWLIHRSGSPIAPAFYVMFGAAAALCVLPAAKNPTVTRDKGWPAAGRS
jgi:MFS transporter, MHS family, proline/betaine transporter